MTALGSLYRRFRQVAERRPTSPAMTFLTDSGRTTRTYSFEELFSRVDELAERLRKLDLGRANPLGILVPTQEGQVLHYLAALDAGTVPAILTPPNRKLNRSYYQETMAEVLRRCGFEAVVLGTEDFDIPTRALAPLTFETIQPAPPPAAPEAPEPLEASFMQFSSGTTGIKRGVLVSDDSVLAQLDVYAGALHLNDDDCLLSWLPLYHDMGFIACLNMPLAHGQHSVMIDPIEWVTNPAIYLRAVSTYRGTLSWHPNFAYAFMAQRVRDREIGGLDLSTLRGLVNCSEPVTDVSQRAFLERYTQYGLAPEVFKGCYAMAETTFALTHGTSTDPNYLDDVGPSSGARPVNGAFVSVGSALPGVEIRIVDPNSHGDLPDGDVGELWVRSPFNFTGYFNDHAATERAFVDGWYRTGDLGYRRESAYYIAGRLKDVLIVAGVNVFPQDIEDMVSGFDGIQSGRVSAFSVFDPRLQTERIVVVAERAEALGDDPDELTPPIRQKLLAAFQIANFELETVEPGWLVKSTSGKMARSANRQKWLDSRTSASAPP
jgi:fatty-acyl-CoA synthase